MSLNSLHFIVCFCFLLVLLTAIQFFRRKNKHQYEILGQIQLLLLLMFSLCFIAIWNWRYCVCSVVYTGAIYVLGACIEKAKHSRVVMIVGIIGSLIMLGYFKYTNFFITSVNELSGSQFKILNIILPLGISFYIFSGISYLIDVYHGKYQAERNLFHFGLYMLFFGKITAGPIVRAGTFLPQVKNYRGIQGDKLLAGMQIFVFGLFKKVVLADHLSVFVDDVFYAPSAYNTGTIILGIVSYSLQIYFDFSGYSDMAIGVAKIVGFDFEPNFNLPYMANDISDFWKRWHISLSSWLQDYLYIPLGGSRRGAIRTYLNLLLVMLVSGLWHGAGYTYILWGFLHGVVSCINRMIKKSRIAIELPKWCDVMLTYVMVALLWVPFRADSIETTVAVWKGAFSIHTGIFQPYVWSFFAIACLLGSEAFAFFKSRKANKSYIHGEYPVLDLTKYWNLVLFFVFVGLTVLMGYFGNTAFIYGKF